MIDVRDERAIDVDAIARLRERCTFGVISPEGLTAMVDGSRWIVHAHDSDADDVLVGFARAISDGVATAYLSSVMVDPAYRRRGVGRAMVGRLMRGRDNIKFVLHTRPDAAAFYAALGFAPASDMMVRERDPEAARWMARR